MESIWTKGKRVCKPTFDARVVYTYFIKKFIHFGAPNAAGEAPAPISTGRLVAREEENRKHNSIADICKKVADHELHGSCGCFHKVQCLGSKNFNLAPQSFICWKIWSVFHRMLCCGSKEWSCLIQRFDTQLSDVENNV